MLLSTLEQAAWTRGVPLVEKWCCSAPSRPCSRRPLEVKCSVERSIAQLRPTSPVPNQPTDEQGVSQRQLSNTE